MLLYQLSEQLRKPSYSNISPTKIQTFETRIQETFSTSHWELLKLRRIIKNPNQTILSLSPRNLLWSTPPHPPTAVVYKLGRTLGCASHNMWWRKRYLYSTYREQKHKHTKWQIRNHSLLLKQKSDVVPRPPSTLVPPANIFQTSVREKNLRSSDGFSKSRIKDITVYEITSLTINSDSTLHHHSYLPVVSRHTTRKHLKLPKNSGWTVQSIQLRTIWAWTSQEYKQTKHQQTVLDT